MANFSEKTQENTCTEEKLQFNAGLILLGPVHTKFLP